MTFFNSVISNMHLSEIFLFLSFCFFVLIQIFIRHKFTRSIEFTNTARWKVFQLIQCRKFKHTRKHVSKNTLKVIPRTSTRHVNKIKFAIRHEQRESDYLPLWIFISGKTNCKYRRRKKTRCFIYNMGMFARKNNVENIFSVVRDVQCKQDAFSSAQKREKFSTRAYMTKFINETILKLWTSETSQ